MFQVKRIAFKLLCQINVRKSNLKGNKSDYELHEDESKLLVFLIYMTITFFK